MKRLFILLFLFLIISKTVVGQGISQFEVFAGRYDYLSFGNTMNIVENGTNAPCDILTSSAAGFELEPDQNIIAAYLYWAGSGTGDFEILLNDNPISAERTFFDQIDEDRVFFAAFANITEILQSSGNGSYTVSELDLTDIIGSYCPTGTNFAGWTITVIYEDQDIPLNVVSVFDGLESVSAFNNELSIELQNLNVLDNENAKIGFIAWEGDAGIAVEETLSINGNLLSNPPLNPSNNQFNGTNSFTGENDLFNMDIDVYNIENNIDVGDTSATISLTSGQDFVMINSVITVLNSQLPDAIVHIDMTTAVCDSRDVVIDYTVGNIGTDELPLGTPITLYSGDLVLEVQATLEAILIGDSVTGTTTVTIPDALGDLFSLRLAIDDDGSGQGTVNEINEQNNGSNIVDVVLSGLSLNLPLLELTACDQNRDGMAIFDLTTIGDEAVLDSTNIAVSYHLSQQEAENGENPILNPSAFEGSTDAQEVFVRFLSLIDPVCQQVETTILTIIPSPLVPILEPLNQCDDISNDGIETFDLSFIVTTIQSEQEGVLITFHESETDAISNQNIIDDFQNFQNEVDQSVIYIRLSSVEAINCFEVTSLSINVIPLDDVFNLPTLTACNAGFELGTFDLTAIEDFFPIESGNSNARYFLSEEDADQNMNSVVDPFAFQNTTNPQTILVRISDEEAGACAQFARFEIQIENCAPFVPDGFSPNNDGVNDVFEISGLKNIFIDYRLRIYSRLGNLIYEGTNEVPFWNGTVNRGVLGAEVPVGVYFYVLQLNDPKFKDQTGWVYLNK